MSESFVLIREGKSTDYHAFWQLFENYMVEVIHTDNLDDHALVWYLSEDYREDFYRRLDEGSSPLHVLLIYYPANEERQAERARKRTGKKHSLFHSRMMKGQALMKEHAIRGVEAKGEFMGFCLYEWSENTSDPCRITCYCMTDEMKERGYQQPAWEQVEKYLYNNGARKLILDRRTLEPFWQVNHFKHSVDGFWTKRL